MPPNEKIKITKQTRCEIEPPTGWEQVPTIAQIEIVPSTEENTERVVKAQLVDYTKQ